MILESDVAAYIETNLKRTATGLKVKQVIPYSAIRRAIAENMTSSLQVTAQVTLTSEVDASSLQKVLSQSSNENRLTYTDLLVQLVSKTLENHPLLNATVEDEQVKIIEEINVGVGVAAESGLVVPVIRNSNKKSLNEISTSLKELGEKAREQRFSSPRRFGGYVHDIEPRNVWCLRFYADHQPAADCNPRSWRDRSKAPGNVRRSY